MKHIVELKMTTDDNGNLDVNDTVLYVDGRTISFVQILSIEASVFGPDGAKKAPRISVCLPDLSETPCPIMREVEDTAEILKQISNVKISFADYHGYWLKKIGTDGNIENLKPYKIERQ